MARTVRVWDLPTRICHWALAACIPASVVSGYIGGAQIEWHARFGYAAVALLLFRLAWGFLGGHWSRFRRFAYSPRRTLAYLRGQGQPDDRVGHNPLGALSVFAMLLVLLAQVATGLLSSDGISFSGPLNAWVSDATARAAVWYHKQVGQWVVVALVVVHVAAVLYYLHRKQDNLIRPMVTGDKQLEHAAVSSRDDALSRGVALALFAACAGAAAWLAGLGNP